MIPLFRPQRPDLNIVLAEYSRALDSGQLTNFGRINSYCENILMAKLGGYWLPVTNGSAALEIALMLLPETVKRVAVPNFTFAATIQAIIRVGLQPVIFEVQDDLEMDVDLLYRHRNKFDAILGVVPFGFRLNENDLEHFASINGKPLIWDRAGAFPSVSHNKICTYSLHASKSLPVGEGGLVYVPTLELLLKARKLSCFGFDDNKNSKYDRAFNFKLDELRASVLLYWLRNLNLIKDRCSRVNSNWLYYDTELREYRGTDVAFADHPNMSLAVLNLKNAKKLSKFLNENGVCSRLYYSPLLEEHKAFKDYTFIGTGNKSLKNWIALPSDVSEGERKLVVYLVKKFYNG